MRPEFPIPSEDLSAYIDNELSDEENADIELALTENESDPAELLQLRGLVSLIGGLPQYEVPRSFALSPEHVREASPKTGVLRFLPVIRSLSVAAVLAFLVVTGVTVYDRIESTDNSNNAGIEHNTGTETPSDASNNATGDTATEGSGLVDRGDSAASNAVPPEPPVSGAAAPGDIAQVESTPAATEAAPEETPVTVATTSDSDDDDNRWLMTSAGLGVLALVLIGLWVVLLRMRRGPTHSSWQAPDITDIS